MSEILSKSIQNEFSKNLIIPGLHKNVSGLDNIDKLIEIDQSPIGRTPRSNPATYSGVFDQIRNLFLKLKNLKLEAINLEDFHLMFQGVGVNIVKVMEILKLKCIFYQILCYL